MKNKVLLDTRINRKSVETLIKLGYEPVFIPECKNLQKPVSAHPDMSVFTIDCVIFTTRELVHLFGDREVVVCKREEEPLKYPKDIMFNCAVVGNNVLCKIDNTNKKVLEYLSLNNYNIVNVNQGYAKCSTCIVSDNAIITEDENIEQAAIKSGIEVLKIKKGFVNLDGYEYGFIGGASGLLNNNLLCFNGNIEKHPDYSRICGFCRKFNVEILSLNDDVLYDVGSIIAI